MLATDKQIAYLQSLADRVECAKRDGLFNIPTPYINWSEERKLGVTTTDASIRIKAYKELIAGINTGRMIMGYKQV